MNIPVVSMCEAIANIMISQLEQLQQKNSLTDGSMCIITDKIALHFARKDIASLSDIQVSLIEELNRKEEGSETDDKPEHDPGESAAGNQSRAV